MIFPTSASYINIHTHHKPKEPAEWVLRNAFHCLTPESIQQLNYAVSVGAHPWFLENIEWDAYFFRLHSYLQQLNVLALGEIGLDRAIKTPLEIQHKYLKSQLSFAEKFKKPVIIHAVRTYTEFIPYLKEFSVPFIFHHFSGNQYEAEQLLKYNAYLSFGKTVLLRQKKV